jgi:hypothetical protein
MEAVVRKRSMSETLASTSGVSRHTYSFAEITPSLLRLAAPRCRAFHLPRGQRDFFFSCSPRVRNRESEGHCQICGRQRSLHLVLSNVLEGIAGRTQRTANLPGDYSLRVIRYECAHASAFSCSADDATPCPGFLKPNEQFLL